MTASLNEKLDSPIVIQDETPGPEKVVPESRLAPAQRLSEEEYARAEKHLKRKLDVRLVAMVWLIFVLNYLDRV